MADPLLWWAGGAVTALGVYTAAQFRPQKDGFQHQTDDQSMGVEEEALADISWIWTGHRTEFDFCDLARIWRRTPEVKETPLPAPTYVHPDIQQFHTDWLGLPTLCREKREILEAILEILDREGNCPSVVNRTEKEPDASYDGNVFAQLATITLRQHSLAVGREIARSMQHPVMIPDALIAGLGHDLGKIPANLSTLYRTGDHPIISIIALNRLSGFESLPNREEIAEAIRQHHMLKTNQPLATALKNADQGVRLREISRLKLTPPKSQSAPKQTEKAPARKKAPGKAPCPAAAIESASQVVSSLPAGPKTPGVEPAENTAVPSPAVEAFQPAPPPSPEEEHSTAPPPELLPEDTPADREVSAEAASDSAPGGGEPSRSVAAGVDLGKLLNGLIGRVNTLEGKRWSVLSTPDGMVLCHPNALWQEMTRLTKDPRLLAAAGDEATKRTILTEVVARLGKEKKAVFSQLIAPGYHTTKCLIVSGGGKAVSSLLVPLRAEAFGLLPSALEALKPPELKQMARMIKLDRTKGKAS